MEPQFWLNRWRNGQIGFHQTAVDPNLKRYWPELQPGANRDRVFVPLCGKSLDLLWLRDQGHFVTGIELSAAAVEAFCMENGVPARRRVRSDFDVYEAENLEILRGDFFQLNAPTLGETAAAYDRGALVSWTPELRSAYAGRIAELLRPRTPMLLIVLEYPQAQMTGPPFSVTADEVRRLYSMNFDIREVGRQDILQKETRFRSLGVTSLFEVCYHLVRQ